MAPAQRKNAKKAGREVAEKPKKLTPEELKAQEEREEREFEEWAEQWCGKLIRFVMVASTLWGFAASALDYASRPPVLLAPQDLRELTYVVTGATSGVGAAVAEALAAHGARVLLAARNVSAGEIAAAAIAARTGNADVEARFLDLADLSSAASFARSLGSEDDGVSGLIHAAGAAGDACDATVDGFERATQVNYVGPALLSLLALPHLDRSGDGRVVFLNCPAAASAGSYDDALLDLRAYDPDPLTPAACDGRGRYARGKMLAVALNDQLGARAAINGFHAVASLALDPVGVDSPGYDAYAAPPARRRFAFGPQVLVQKALGVALGPVLRPLGRALKVGRWTLRSPAEAARGVAHLATSADLARVSGARFSLAAGALSPGAGCQAPSPDLCGRAPPLPDGFKADAARVFDATYDALLPYIEEL